jgi:hypothetical protein
VKSRRGGRREQLLDSLKERRKTLRLKDALCGELCVDRERERERDRERERVRERES